MEKAHSIHEEATIAILVLVRGRVQGVGFRYEARSFARSLGLSGWITNLPDGGVETYAEGHASDVDRYKRWLEHGPPGARVESIDVSERNPKGTLTGFIIE
jgi:acylphosphatase